MKLDWIGMLLEYELDIEPGPSHGEYITRHLKANLYRKIQIELPAILSLHHHCLCKDILSMYLKNYTNISGLYLMVFYVY